MLSPPRPPMKGFRRGHEPKAIDLWKGFSRQPLPRHVKEARSEAFVDACRELYVAASRGKEMPRWVGSFGKLSEPERQAVREIVARQVTHECSIKARFG